MPQEQYVLLYWKHNLAVEPLLFYLFSWLAHPFTSCLISPNLNYTVLRSGVTIYNLYLFYKKEQPGQLTELIIVIIHIHCFNSQRY